MKKLSVLLFGVSALLVVSPPVMAQAAAPRHIVHPPIVVAPGPYNPSSPQGILPVEFKAAYGFNRIPNQGQGQTIALIDAYDDPNITSDVAFYASYFHLGPCNFTKVKLGTVEGQGWDLEESLDVEQACALAPQANIVLVEAASDNDTDLYAAIQVAVAAPYNATVVSMSWGEQEFDGEQNYDVYFCNVLNGNGQPVTFVAATGDSGHYTYYPSTSPCVVAAGGTTLALLTAAPLSNPLQMNYGGETAWQYSSGGVSCYGGIFPPCTQGGEPQPSWQNPACSPWTTQNRCVPDIASDGNPNTGVPVYDTYSYVGWVPVGGTSLASPDWASFFTLVNSARVLAGRTTLSHAAEDLYNVYYSGNYSTNFHDITSGTNGSCGSMCTAGVGYDLVTGIGSYQANDLYPPLVADPN